MTFIFDTLYIFYLLFVCGLMTSDSVYVEIIGKSSDLVFMSGTENEISVERLYDNLIKLSFSSPDKEKKWVEYWFRVPSPDMRIMVD